MQNTAILQTIIDNIEEGVYFVDRTRTIKMWNAAAQQISGYTQDEMVGLRCQDTHLNHIDKEGYPLCELSCPLYATIGDGMRRSADVLLRHKAGHRVPIKVRAIPVYDDNKEIVGALEIFTPASSTQYEDNLVESLISLAMRDSLTGLPNRAYMESYLQHKFSEFERYGKKFCVLFTDVDNFNHFNNYYGHAVGDAVLQTISKSFQKNLRQTDVMGRWGGEEFLAVIDTGPNSDLQAIGNKICRLVSTAQVMHQNKPLNVTASVGVAEVQEGDTPESITIRADFLMYQSKKSGKNCCTIETTAPLAPPYSL